MTDRAYVRVYYSIIDDPKFATVYDNDRHLATWLRLLMTADPVWPASAQLPASAKPASVAELIRVGLVDLTSGGRFRIHGLDAERNDRHEQARSASNARWNARSNATASGVRMPNQTEPNQTEPSRADSEHDALDTYYELTFYRPWGMWSGDALKGAITDYGDAKVSAALHAEYDSDADRATLLKRTQARLARDAEHSKRDRPKPQKRPEQDRAAINAEVMRLMALPSEEAS